MKQKTAKEIREDITYYWYFNKAISQEICQKIINLGEGKWDQAETLGTSGYSHVRKSDIVWIHDQWVYDLIWPYMANANEQGAWKYNIAAAEDCQVTRYTKDGFFSWHKDGTGSHDEIYVDPDKKLLYGNARKLSMTLILNDDYEGGNFEIGGLKEKERVPRLEKGSVIVFPSFHEHRVTPVTKGTRYSLVAWFVGPPFI